jgi:hypothetical protein
MSGYAVFSRFSLNYGASKLVEIIFLSPTSLDVSMRQPRIFIYSRSGSAGLWFPWGAGERLLKNTNTTANQSKVFPYHTVQCTGLNAFSHLQYLYTMFSVLVIRRRLICSQLETRGRILGRNTDKSLKSFPPFYSQSLYSFALRFLFLQTHLTSYIFLQLMQPLTYFYKSVDVLCKGKRRKTW